MGFLSVTFATLFRPTKILTLVVAAAAAAMAAGDAVTNLAQAEQKIGQ